MFALPKVQTLRLRRFSSSKSRDLRLRAAADSSGSEKGPFCLIQYLTARIFESQNHQKPCKIWDFHLKSARNRSKTLISELFAHGFPSISQPDGHPVGDSTSKRPRFGSSSSASEAARCHRAAQSHAMAPSALGPPRQPSAPPNATPAAPFWATPWAQSTLRSLKGSWLVAFRV